MPDLAWKDAIVQVLRNTSDPMHYTEIAEAIAEQKLRSDFGATPAASVAATITISMQNEGTASPFIRISRGYYSLKDSEETTAVGFAEESEQEEAEEETSLINAFGMYWRRDYVYWVSSSQILGQQQPSSEAVDFCSQKGVYLLYDGSKVVYVGRASDQPIGVRLKQHTVDRLNGRWDRFSWFGVYPVTETGGLLSDGSDNFSVENLITTMEALLIEGLEPPQNRKRGDDFRAVEFLQVEDPAIQKSRIVELMNELKKKL